MGGASNRYSNLAKNKGKGAANSFNSGPGGSQQIGASQKLLQNESNSLLLNFTKKLLEKSIRKFP